MDDTAALLKELTEINGVSGHEAAVREAVRSHLEPLGDVTQDNIGSLLCTLEQGPEGPIVMLAGHMDEIGFMVRHISKEGFIRFLPLGGWFDQVLLGHRVTIQTTKGPVTGVIGAKPPHLLPAEEREKLVKRTDMYIDIGATSEEEVEAAGVRLGDPVVPQAAFEELARPNAYLSKAFDDRVGVALMIQALQALKGTDLPNRLIGVATVMEEVGLRGAATSVEAADPDVAIILEVDIAGDVPGIKDEQSAIQLGKGPSVLIYDRRMIPNLKLRDLVMATADELGIPLQMSAIEGGATDGGVIHLHKTGVPTVVIAVPTRHIHSHSAILHRQDYDQALTLLTELVKRLDADTVSDLVR